MRLNFSESERTKKIIATFLKEVKKMPRAGQHFWTFFEISKGYITDVRHKNAYVHDNDASTSNSKKTYLRESMWMTIWRSRLPTCFFFQTMSRHFIDDISPKTFFRRRSTSFTVDHNHIGGLVDFWMIWLWLSIIHRLLLDKRSFHVLNSHLLKEGELNTKWY